MANKRDWKSRLRWPSLSVEPVLYLEPWHFFKVHEVAGEEEGVVGYADGGDF